MNQEEVRELHGNVGGALAQLTERGGGLTTAHLSGVEACLHRAHVLTTQLMGEPAVMDNPEERALATGLVLGRLLRATRGGPMNEDGLMAELSGTDVLIRVPSMGRGRGAAYRLRLERSVDDEPF